MIQSPTHRSVTPLDPPIALKFPVFGGQALCYFPFLAHNFTTEVMFLSPFLSRANQTLFTAKFEVNVPT